MKFADFATGFVGAIAFCVVWGALAASVVYALAQFGGAIGGAYAILLIGAMCGASYAADEADKRKKAEKQAAETKP